MTKLELIIAWVAGTIMAVGWFLFYYPMSSAGYIFKYVTPSAIFFALGFVTLTRKFK